MELLYFYILSTNHEKASFSTARNRIESISCTENVRFLLQVDQDAAKVSPRRRQPVHRATAAVCDLHLGDPHGAATTRLSRHRHHHPLPVTRHPRLDHHTHLVSVTILT